MRSITVSTGVYAAIWAKRIDGEETEDEILGRLLNVAPATGASKAAALPGSGGVLDGRSGVHFEEGFRIFRRYKGRDYAAVAAGGQWRREDNGILFPSINRLNSSIVSGTENVWNGNWKFRTPNGSTASIAALRR